MATFFGCFYRTVFLGGTGKPKKLAPLPEIPSLAGISFWLILVGGCLNFQGSFAHFRFGHLEMAPKGSDF